MRLKRRQFLQQSGLALTALGLWDTLSLFSNAALAASTQEQYQQVAPPTSRKLALLVGINQYTRNSETKLLAPLQGCVTDVELQKELLIHKFGFNPADILTLTDKDATRQNIETAFLEHLINQAKADDVVVFHFSGYGSQVNLNDDFVKEDKSKIQNSLVPVDGVVLPSGVVGENVILEETLRLLLRSLATDRVTTILDTSFSDASSIIPGNLRIRSLASALTEQPFTEELALQSQLLKQFNSQELLKIQKEYAEISGILLAAASPNQVAAEVPWSGFSAGLFTYFLTQNLWQANPSTTLYFNLSHTVETIRQLVDKQQYPQLIIPKNKQSSIQAYNLLSQSNISADGVILAVEDNNKAIQLWLAGIPANVLEYYSINSILTVVSSNLSDKALNEIPVDSETQNQQQSLEITTAVSTPLQLQIRSREGITARAKIFSNTSDTSTVNSLKVGDFVQESVRILPRAIGLSIGLDTNLERIERVDATSAFANISANVSSVLSFLVTGDQNADYLFGKILNKTNSNKQEAKSDKENINQDVGGSYGLFSLNYNLIPDTSGESGEAIKVAVNRLVPTLKTLLAAKLWRLTANEGSSRLGVKATLEIIAPEEKVLMQRETLRSKSSEIKPIYNQNSSLTKKADTSKQQTVVEITTVPVGSSIQYQIQNFSDQDIYIIMLGLDSSGSAIAFYPLQAVQTSDPNTKPTLKEIIIPAGETLTIPQSSANSGLVIQDSTGITENYIICSKAPFTQTMAALEATKRSPRQEQFTLSNPLDVARALLQDLHQASSINAAQNLSYLPDTITASDLYILDVNTWVTLSFIYEVA